MQLRKTLLSIQREEIVSSEHDGVQRMGFVIPFSRGIPLPLGSTVHFRVHGWIRITNDEPRNIPQVLRQVELQN